MNKSYENIRNNKNINIIQMPLNIINKNDISKGLERTLIFVFIFFSIVPNILRSKNIRYIFGI